MIPLTLSVNKEIITTKTSGQSTRFDGFMYTKKHVGESINQILCVV